MEAATALAADDPIMVAWNEYAATDDYKNSFKWAEHEQYRAGSMWAAFLAGWQASHPASAPAPAAPRVGDEVRESLPLIIEICDAAFHIVDDSEVDNGLQETPVFTADLTRLRKAVEAAEEAEVYIHGEPDDDDVLRRALSAPPAASADEREDRVQVADEMRSYFYEDAAECSPHKYAEFLQCADIALGYRKLAPAQSVGQSAAQGVGEVRAQTIEEIAQWFLSEVRYWGNVKEQDWSQHVVSHLRRLSALPKGQEHE